MFLEYRLLLFFRLVINNNGFFFNRDVPSFNRVFFPLFFWVLMEGRGIDDQSRQFIKDYG